MCIMRVETVSNINFDDFLALVSEYQASFGFISDIQKNRKHFSKYLVSNETALLLISYCKDQPAGFALLIKEDSSFTAEQKCFLSDLFVREKFRGKGVARSLIEYCQTYAFENGFDMLEWRAENSATMEKVLFEEVNATPTEFKSYIIPAKGQNKNKETEKKQSHLHLVTKNLDL